MKKEKIMLKLKNKNIRKLVADFKENYKPGKTSLKKQGPQMGDQIKEDEKEEKEEKKEKVKNNGRRRGSVYMEEDDSMKDYHEGLYDDDEVYD